MLVCTQIPGNIRTKHFKVLEMNDDNVKKVIKAIEALISLPGYYRKNAKERSLLWLKQGANVIG